MRSGLIYYNSLDRSISNSRVSAWFVFIMTLFIKIPEFNENRVDPDQTPHFAASNLGLHSLPMPL